MFLRSLKFHYGSTGGHKPPVHRTRKGTTMLRFKVFRIFALAAFAIAPVAVSAGAHPIAKPTILLRSGWQTVNTGDIVHTPGLLAVLERTVPAAEPTLMRRFPILRIVKSLLDACGAPASAELREAFAAADLLVHGSAASVTSQPQVDARTASNPGLGEDHLHRGGVGFASPRAPRRLKTRETCRFQLRPVRPIVLRFIRRKPRVRRCRTLF